MPSAVASPLSSRYEAIEVVVVVSEAENGLGLRDAADEQGVLHLFPMGAAAGEGGGELRGVDAVVQDEFRQLDAGAGGFLIVDRLRECIREDCGACGRRPVRSNPTNPCRGIPASDR